MDAWIMEQQDSRNYYRYCPGEERVRISDAICLGRRRTNYPKCAGCPFNDDQKKGAHPPASARPATAPARLVEPLPDPIETVFKACDVRAKTPDPLNADLAWRIGHATAQFLRSELRGYDRGRTEKSTVVVGRDMRKSSPELAEALMDGLESGGSPVIEIGLVDTPQLYFAVNHLGSCGGVQVTASHNPPGYNGFKICGRKARPVSEDTGLSKIQRIAQHTLRHITPQRAGRQQRDLTSEYKAFVLDFLNEPVGGYSDERPMKIVVDASNGMAGRWFPIIFGEVDWLEIIPLNFEHNGEFVHDPDPLVEGNLSQACDRVIRSKADLGLCFDGDADRVVFIDNQGRPVSADLLTALLAKRFLREYPGSTIIYDVRSSRVVPEEIRKAGGVPRRERCGHAFIKKALSDSRGAFAGELSGHYYFRENSFCDSGMIAFAELVNTLMQSGQTLGELIAPLNRFANSGERSFQCDHIKPVIENITRKYNDGEVDFLDGVTVQYADWWFNVRPSNTEPLLRLNVEAASQAMLDARLHELYPLLGKPVR